MDSRLVNDDIAPVEASRRTWNALHYFSLWVGMAICIPTYMIAASLIGGGMNWKQAMLTVFLGNVIVLIPMILNGHVGAKYGIAYPVFARAAFGIRGSNIPAMLRALVACGWFGIQSWIGGAAIYSMLLAVFPSLHDISQVVPHFLGTDLMAFTCFLGFWAINMALIWKGVESIKWLETACAPFLIASGLALLAWAYFRADGFGPLLSAPSKFTDFSSFWNFFVPALTGMVGFWATLCLNISDFTRYSKSQRDQILGQSLGLPTTMSLFAFIGIAVTSATIVLYGAPIWDPVVLVRKFESPVVVFVSMFAVVIATLSTNVAANVVGPANDFANLAPKRINFKVGGTITGILGILMMPWKLIADPSGYIFTWLIGYSALLGPIAGILLADYYFIRRTRLHVNELFSYQGRYFYQNGFNVRALIALGIGIAPNLPGFLAQTGVLNPETVPGFVALYHYAWFLGLALSATTYTTLMWTRRLSLADLTPSMLGRAV